MRKSFIAALTLATVVLSSPALATVLVGQTTSPNPPAGGSNGQFRFYDDFRLSGDATVTSISWWAASGAADTGTFNISFSAANGYAPVSTPLYSTTISATSTVAGQFLTKYVALLPTTALLAGNTNYFLSIYRSDASFYWAAATSPSAPGVYGSALSYSTYPGGGILQAMDLSWELNGDYGFATPVPEPATWAMMLIGFGMVAGATRYRRRATRIAYG